MTQTTEQEATWKAVVEPKTVHVAATDGLPPVSEYPVGYVIESPDGERFRLDRVQPRTQWVPVEAHVPEKIDYTKLSVRQLIVAIQQDDEDAGTELERRMSGGAAATTTTAEAAATPDDVPPGFEAIPGQAGAYRRI